MSQLRLAQLGLLATTFLWGTTFPVTKDLIQRSPPLPYLTVRFALGGLLLLLWMRVFPTRQAKGQDPDQGSSAGLLRDGLVLAILLALGLFFQVLGQAYTTASKSAFVTALSVPLTPVCALILRRSTPNLAQGLAVVVGFFGLFLLTYPQEAVAWNRGDLLTLLCALVFGVSIVETAHRTTRHDVARLSMVLSLLTAALFGMGLVFSRVLLSLFPEVVPAILPAALVEQESRPFALSTTLLLQLLYMASVCTTLTFLLQNWSMARMSATQAAILFALEPVFATVLSLLWYGAGEWPGTRGGIGAGLVLFSVFLSELRLTRAARKPDTPG